MAESHVITTLPVSINAFPLPQTEYLLTKGWDVIWICAKDKEFSKKIHRGAKFIPIPFKRGNDPFGAPKAMLMLYLIFKREHFEMIQYATPNAAFYASTAAWLARVPVRVYAQLGICYVGF